MNICLHATTSADTDIAYTNTTDYGSDYGSDYETDYGSIGSLARERGLYSPEEPKVDKRSVFAGGDLYLVLNIKKGSDIQAVKDAYKKRVKECHPGKKTAYSIFLHCV